MRLFIQNPLEVKEQLQAEMSIGNNWLVYNTMEAIISTKDLHYFPTKGEADQFCRENISDYDAMHAIPVKSLLNAIEQKVTNQSNSTPLKQETLNEIRSHLKEQNASFIKNTTMNQKNFDYLKDQVKFTGFGESLEKDLRENIQKQSPEFKIYHNGKFGNDLAVATLHFKKSDLSDMYFFNKYNLTVKPENSPDMLEQTFYINKANNITLKEAYNLMSGRAINKDLTNKEGQVYNAWVQMDFKETDKNGNYQLKQYHTNYGYDLEKELTKHPIKELLDEQEKNKLKDSLLKGNRQSVTFINEGKEQKMFIEANPRFKSVNVYDNNMQRVNIPSQREKSAPEQSVKQEAKKENEKQADENDEGTPKASKKKAKSKKQSIS